MVRLGKTYGNLMVDVQATNEKLVERSLRIVRAVTGCNREDAATALERAGGSVKTAIVVQALGLTPEQARKRLDAADGQLRTVLETGTAEGKQDG